MKNKNTAPEAPKDQKVLLAYIGSALLQDRVDEFNAAEEEGRISFSAVFLHKIHKLMARYKFKYRVKRTKPFFKRLLLTVLLVCTFAFVGCVSVPAVREAVITTVITEYEKFFNLNVTSDDPFEGPLVPKTLTYIPDGFELSIEEVNHFHYWRAYFNDNRLLVFSQDIINDKSDGNYDNELSEIFYMEYNGIEILATQYDNNGNTETSLIWNDGIYLYEIYGNFSMYEAIQVLNGIE